MILQPFPRKLPEQSIQFTSFFIQHICYRRPTMCAFHWTKSCGAEIQSNVEHNRSLQGTVVLLFGKEKEKKEMCHIHSNH